MSIFYVFTSLSVLLVCGPTVTRNGYEFQNLEKKGFLHIQETKLFGYFSWQHLKMLGNNLK